MTHATECKWILGALLFSLLVTPVFCETLYLKDSSVLKGAITTGTSNDTLLSNPLFGEVSVLNEDILYQETNNPEGYCELYTLIDNGAWVLSHLTRNVPTQQPQRHRFSMMIPGAVQTVLDANGFVIPHTQRVITGNTLITMDFNDLPETTTTLNITTQRAGLVYQEKNGHLTFQLKHIPNEDQDIKMIVRYPSSLKPQTITPEPVFECAGLIIWELSLRRQQHFQPRIQFSH